MMSDRLTSLSADRITLSELKTIYTEVGDGLDWTSPFVTPPWLEAWYQSFAQNEELLVLQISAERKVLGIAPLMVEGRVARLIGSPDLCDHGDLIPARGQEDRFCREMLEYLRYEGIRQVVFPQVRPDSTVYRYLLPVARSLGWHQSVRQRNSTMEMALPAGWEGYLQKLDGKQRHEARRKLRRLQEAGTIELRVESVGENVQAVMDVFLDLFRSSRADKRKFMTRDRERFFRRLAEGLSQYGMLSLLVVTLDEKVLAVLFCATVDKTLYLYNNGFDPRFKDLSPGMVSKLLSIKMSIESGLKTYDFLSGTEKYKYHLGGAEVPLYECLLSCERASTKD